MGDPGGADLGQLMQKHATELERSLQIATGAVILALLGVLMNIWEMDGYRIKVAIKTAMQGFIIAFLAAAFATLVRIILVTMAQSLALYAWWLLVTVSMILVIASGYKFFSDLQAQVSKIKDGEHEVLQSKNALDASRYLERMRDCLAIEKLRWDVIDSGGPDTASKISTVEFNKICGKIILR